MLPLERRDPRTNFYQIFILRNFIRRQIKIFQMNVFFCDFLSYFKIYFFFYYFLKIKKF